MYTNYYDKYNVQSKECDDNPYYTSGNSGGCSSGSCAKYNYPTSSKATKGGSGDSCTYTYGSCRRSNTNSTCRPKTSSNDVCRYKDPSCRTRGNESSSLSCNRDSSPKCKGSNPSSSGSSCGVRVVYSCRRSTNPCGVKPSNDTSCNRSASTTTTTRACSRQSNPKCTTSNGQLGNGKSITANSSSNSSDSTDNAKSCTRSYKPVCQRSTIKNTGSSVGSCVPTNPSTKQSIPKCFVTKVNSTSCSNRSTTARPISYTIKSVNSSKGTLESGNTSTGGGAAGGGGVSMCSRSRQKSDQSREISESEYESGNGNKTTDTNYCNRYSNTSRGTLPEDDANNAYTNHCNEDDRVCGTARGNTCGDNGMLKNYCHEYNQTSGAPESSKSESGNDVKSSPIYTTECKNSGSTTHVHYCNKYKADTQREAPKPTYGSYCAREIFPPQQTSLKDTMLYIRNYNNESNIEARQSPRGNYEERTESSRYISIMNRIEKKVAMCLRDPYQLTWVATTGVTPDASDDSVGNGPGIGPGMNQRMDNLPGYKERRKRNASVIFKNARSPVCSIFLSDHHDDQRSSETQDFPMTESESIIPNNVCSASGSKIETMGHNFSNKMGDEKQKYFDIATTSSDSNDIIRPEQYFSNHIAHSGKVIGENMSLALQCCFPGGENCQEQLSVKAVDDRIENIPNRTNGETPSASKLAEVSTNCVTQQPSRPLKTPTSRFMATYFHAGTESESCQASAGDVSFDTSVDSLRWDSFSIERECD